MGYAIRINIFNAVVNMSIESKMEIKFSSKSKKINMLL